MNDSLKEKLLHLRLNRLASHWEEDLKEAARQRMSHATLLTHVIEEEYRLNATTPANSVSNERASRSPGQ